MLEIEHTLVSLDLITETFVCHVPVCHGDCCLHGESGAPLTKKEKQQLDIHLPAIVPYLTDEGLAAIDAAGTGLIDSDGDLVTPLIDGNECAFAFKQDSIWQCGIEKAWEAGKQPLQKPLSCHLYPVRVSQVGDYHALNYDQWSICQPGRLLGKQEGVLLYQFLKDALIRAYGNEWYDQLSYAAENLEL